MLREIHIKNLSIIESAAVTFHDGFHVVSGETGSGKSILLTAISFALGSRADTDLIRAGQDEAVVTLALDPSARPRIAALLEAAGVAVAEDEEGIFLRRTLNQAGRSRAFLNDQPVTLKTLQAIAAATVHVVAQHAAQRLLEPDFLLEGLDRAGGLEKYADDYRDAFHAYQATRRAFAEWQDKVARAREQEDFLRFQCRELAEAGLNEGEEDELEGRKARLKYRVTLANHGFEMRQALAEGDDSVLDRLGKVQSLAEKSSQLDPTLKPVLQAVAQALDQVHEAARGLADYGSDLSEDPGELDRIEDRLAALAELKRKYRLDMAGLIAKAAELEVQVRDLENFDEQMAATQKSLAADLDALEKRAKVLGAARRKAGAEFGKKLQGTLKDLALPHSRVEFVFTSRGDAERYRDNGPDDLHLFVSFNPGEEPRPMEEIASGGELSRLLLAFCEILYSAASLGTMIFDEVDAGVGGKAAELIGKKLERLSRRVQVLCVTHLPQIACHGARHYSVEKEVRSGRTFSKVELLSAEQRVAEIARMLAGVKVTDQALKHAKELLKNAAA